jgi:hypothetical protein
VNQIEGAVSCNRIANSTGIEIKFALKKIYEFLYLLWLHVGHKIHVHSGAGNPVR